MKTARRREAWYKGLAGEYRVMYYLLLAAKKSARPDDVVFHPREGFALNGFSEMKKRTFHVDQSTAEEVDIFARADLPDDADLIVEVKTWSRPVDLESVTQFIKRKKCLKTLLERPTVFLFYSENGFSENGETLLRDHGIMFTTFDKLTSMMT